METELYDVLILGAGPAGLSAGIYAARAGLKTLLIDKGMDGGQIALTQRIENYPGQPLSGESGQELTARMAAQARHFGCARASDAISGCELAGEIKTLHGAKRDYRGRSLILCTGATVRQIGCENEEKFIGRGVSYCAVCDAPFFRGLEIVSVGGNAAALEEALYLAGFARRVTVVHRLNTLNAGKELLERIGKTENISVLTHTEIASLGGGELLEEIVLKDTLSGAETRMKADPADGLLGCFCFTGKRTTTILDGALETENGYIPTNERMETAIPGVYAAGDVRVTPLRQVVTACADGAVAAVYCEKFLSKA